MEIYNEQVIDLMVDNSPNLMILEDLNKGMTVQDLTEYQVANSNELLGLILTGNARRFMAATGEFSLKYSLFRAESVFFTFSCDTTDNFRSKAETAKQLKRGNNKLEVLDGRPRW